MRKSSKKRMPALAGIRGMHSMRADAVQTERRVSIRSFMNSGGNCGI